MSSKKLNTAIRVDIRQALILHSFGEEAVHLNARAVALSNDIYQSVYSTKTRATMEALPKGWLPEQDHLTVELGDTRTRAQFSGLALSMLSAGCGSAMIHRLATLANRAGEVGQVEGKRRVFTRHVHTCAKVYGQEHPLTKRHAKLIDRAIDLNDRVQEAEASITAVLNSVTTMNRLLEVWPQVQPHIPEQHLRATSALPAVPIDQLNAQLALQ